MSDVETKERPLRFVYAFDELDQVPEGPSSAQIIAKRKFSGKSSSFGAALSGETMHVGLVHKARGTGSKLHTHPNEQFNFVMQGTLQCDIGGQTVRVPKGSVIHIPAGTVHSCCATWDEDVIFFVCKDKRGGLAGPPIDGKEDGPRVLPKA